MLIAPVLLAGDAGTPFVMIPIAMARVFLAGAPWRPILYAIGLAAIGGAALVMNKSYRLERLGSSWFNPFADASGSGYQSAHGQYAIAGGGWIGVGLGSGREKWGGLPAAHTDFILASIAEETGVIMASLVILMLGAISFWFLRIALHHQDFVARSVCAGVGVWIGWQSIVNIAMVVNFLPVIGVTLPLVSFGGTSMVATLAGIGLGIAFLASVPSVESRNARTAATNRQQASV
jgi:cell division protein FtsW